MGIKEKKAIVSVTVCDLCLSELEHIGTHISASSEGYMKKDHFEFDLCPDCAAKIGLRRRGRKPSEAKAESDGATAPSTPRKRGRPRKQQMAAAGPEKENSDEDWEASAKAS